MIDWLLCYKIEIYELKAVIIIWLQAKTKPKFRRTLSSLATVVTITNLVTTIGWPIAHQFRTIRFSGLI